MIFWSIDFLGQCFGCFVPLLGNWHAFFNQRLNLLHIPADDALIQVKQKAGQRVGHVKAVNTQAAQETCSLHPT
jgi:hypothetical protein